MKFDQARFLAALQVVQTCAAETPLGIYQGVPHVQVFDRLASTNRTLWQLMEQGAPPETVAIALEQSAGKGQWGRQWQSLPGGLYLSVSLAPQLPVEQRAQLTMATAWGIATALWEIPARLSGVVAGIPIQLKWLNDLVLEGHKLGGILAETRLQQESITQAVVGVGINWINPVPPPGINLKNFLESHPVPLIESLEMLAAITLQGLLSGYYYCQQLGIEAFLPLYLERLMNLGQPIQLEQGRGVIFGVSAKGELQVRLEVDSSAETAENQPVLQEIYLKPGTISLGYG